MTDIAFGRTTLPAHQAATLRRAIRFEWITIGFLVVAVTLVGLVLGNSQAMKAAWAEDLLSLAPPIAFLVATRIIRRPHTPKWPYGYHRSTGVAHLVAGVALAAMGTFLIIDSGAGLFTAEHPSIGSVELFGSVFWLGWLMIGAMVITGVPPVFLGRVKMKLAEDLHDKVLYADADMNKADWMTALGSIIGVTGIGLGLWWLDAVAALFISFTILSDGVKNMRSAIRDLMDARATTFDNARPDPVIGRGRGVSRGPGLGGGGRSPRSRPGSCLACGVFRGPGRWPGTVGGGPDQSPNRLCRARLAAAGPRDRPGGGVARRGCRGESALGHACRPDRGTNRIGRIAAGCIDTTAGLR